MAQVLVRAIVERVDQLTANGGPVPSATADELRGQIARLVELVAPLDGPTGRGDDPVRAFNLHVRAWIEETARLMVGHLDM